MQLLIQKVLLMGVAAAAAAAAPPILVKPGCPDKCGNLSVPYPFGVREGCYHDQTFFINCSTSNTSFLGAGNIQVLMISLTGKLRVPSYVARVCYGKGGGIVYRNAPSLRSGGTYKLSTYRNKFIAVGCDTNAVITSSSGNRVATGCLSLCYTPDSVINGSCSGIGCCQTSIPKGIGDFEFSVTSYNNHSDVMEFNPCSYAFIVEDGLYNFTSLDLVELRSINAFPVVFDWVIANKTCEEARKDRESYACIKNNVCVDADNGPGYICRCPAGSGGNPYLPNGCQDINECESAKLHDCLSGETCLNLYGSYICFCPRGYVGDGTRSGIGCIPQPHDPFLHRIVTGLGSILGFLILIVSIWLSCKIIKRRQAEKLKQKFFKRNGGKLLEQQISSTENHVEKTKIFTSKELDKATDHYHVNRILGQGGQGTVYKGMLTDGRVVAIKKSKVVDEDKLEQFINEVVILSQINHRNVVKILGCCLETEVPQLVYEFIPNGSLSQYLQVQREEFPITWEMRMRIATEVAGALSYLHSAACIPIYHRDIKSSNILLDEKYRAIVADFGTSKSVSIDQTHVTTRVQGTFGYLDPEYFQTSQFTDKSDVYSFGVVLVELLTGQRPISSLRSVEERSIAQYFLVSMEEDRLFEILDDRVVSEGRKDEIIGVANLAKRCLNLNRKKRPEMKVVAMELEGIRASQGAYEYGITTEDHEEVSVGDHIRSWEMGSTSTVSKTSKVINPLDLQPLLYSNTV